MEAQLQIRQNAQEIQEYMKDLLDWQNDVRKKENKLKDQKNNNSGSSAPLRGKVVSGPISAPSPELQKPDLPYFKKSSSSSVKNGEEDFTKGSLKSQLDKANAAAHTYSSYSKWDKFDIDAALAAAESEKGQKGVDSALSKSSSKATSSAKKSTRATAQDQPVFKPGESLNSVVPAPKIQVMDSPQSLLESKKNVMLDDAEDFAGAVAASARSASSSSAAEPLMTPIATSYTRRAPEPKSSESSSSLKPDTDPNEAAHPPVRNQAPRTAEAWRLRGNDLFRAREWAMARECYDRSLMLQPSAPALANRALTCLKLGEWAAAEQDCDAALELDPKFVKAFLRRGEARRKLGKLLEAAEDFEFVVLLEPNNAAASADRDAAFAAFAAQEGLTAQLAESDLELDLNLNLDTEDSSSSSSSSTGKSGILVKGGPWIRVPNSPRNNLPAVTLLPSPPPSLTPSLSSSPSAPSPSASSSTAAPFSSDPSSSAASLPSSPPVAGSRPRESLSEGDGEKKADSRTSTDPTGRSFAPSADASSSAPMPSTLLSPERPPRSSPQPPSNAFDTPSSPSDDAPLSADDSSIFKKAEKCILFDLD